MAIRKEFITSLQCVSTEALPSIFGQHIVVIL